MKKFFWMAACVMVSTSLLAQNPAPSPATNSPAAKPAPKKAPGKSPAKKSAEKKPAASAAPVIAEKPIVLVPGPGTITGDNVNVRGHASFIGEIVKRLNKGDAVEVIEQVIREKPKAGEPSQWAKISYPKGANVWVHNTYISNSVVVPKRLNVRAGPGENYSIVGLIERGATVKQVSNKGNWVEIEPASDAFAFVAAQYVKQDGKAPEVPPTVSIAPPVRETPATTTAVAEPPTVAATTTDTSSEPPKPLVPDEDTKPAPPPDEPLPPRIVSHEGVVRPTVSIQAPTRYEIWEPSTRMSINYLYTSSTNLDLSRYKGRRIIVTGEEGLDRRWKNTPVITIQRIQVIENAR